MLFTVLTFADATDKPLGNPVRAKSRQEALRFLQTTKAWASVSISQETERGRSPLASTYTAREIDAARNVIGKLPTTEAEYVKQYGRIISDLEQKQEQEALQTAFAKPEQQEFNEKECWTPFFRSASRMSGEEYISFDVVSLVGMKITRGLGDAFPYVRYRTQSANGRSGGGGVTSTFNRLTAQDSLLPDILLAFSLAKEGKCSAVFPTYEIAKDTVLPDGVLEQTRAELFRQSDVVRVQDLLDLLNAQNKSLAADVLLHYEQTKAEADKQQREREALGSKTLPSSDASTMTSASSSLQSISAWFTTTTVSCPRVQGVQEGGLVSFATIQRPVVEKQIETIRAKNSDCREETSLSPVKVLGTSAAFAALIVGVGMLMKK